MSDLDLTDAGFELVAERFAALAVPARLKILSALRVGERSQTELIEATGLAQANLSKHLQVLVRNRFIDRRPDGNSTYYRIGDDDVFRLCDLMCGRLLAEAAARADLFQVMHA